MRGTAATAAILILGSTATAAGQLPLPEAVMQAETIYVESNGSLDRKTLGHAAEEFYKQRRFRLVANRLEADLLVVFAKGTEDGDSYVLPLPGVGLIAGTEKHDIFFMVVVDPATEESVWNDQREKHFTVRGAVKHLVKELHEAIKAAH